MLVHAIQGNMHTSYLYRSLKMVKVPICLTVLGLIAVCSCAAQQYYISTDDTPNECPTQPCHPLSHYIQNVSHYFTSNTYFEFLPGTHSVTSQDGFIVISNVSNITLRGDYNSTRLVCITTELTSFVFIFINVYNLLLEDLSFLYCGHPIGQFSEMLPSYYSSSPEIHAALLLIDIHSLQLSNVSVENSTGYGLLGVNVLGDSLISNSVFTFNNYYVMNVWNYCEFLLLRRNLSCQGGNVMLIYVDPVECPTDMQVYSMTIVRSVFSFGANLYVSSVNIALLSVFHGSGLNVVLWQRSYGVNITTDSVISTENTASTGANLYFAVCKAAVHTQIRITRNSITKGNSSVGSGLMFLYGFTTIISMHCHSKENSVNNILDISHSIFSENVARVCGTCFTLSLGKQTNLLAIVESCIFTRNKGLIGASVSLYTVAEEDGIKAKRPKQNYEVIWKNTSFIANERLESIYNRFFTYYVSVFNLRGVDNITMDGCRFIKNNLTALVAFRSRLKLQGELVVIDNVGEFGGGIALYDQASIYFTPHTHLYLANNHAKRGGGIYLYTQPSGFDDQCFFQLNLTDYTDIQVVLKDNHADEAGDTLYGGWVDNCYIQHSNNTVTSVFDTVFKIVGNSTSEISSLALGVCICIDHMPACSGKTRRVDSHTYPGGTFRIALVPIGQRNGPVPSIVQAEIISGHGNFAPLQETQDVEGKCTVLEYSVFSNEVTVTLLLYPQHLNAEGLFAKFNSIITIWVDVHLLPCPPGFELSHNTGQCVCTSVLQKRDVQCDINGERPLIQRTGSVWINLSLSRDDVIVHDHCPFDYCKPTDIWLHLDDPDKQCAYGHSGVLCGGCTHNLSLALGTSHCLHCSNTYLTFLVMYALAGLALVLLLIFCNLTISVGTINGLVFYANVVRVNNSVFFAQEQSIAPFFKDAFSVFIAWINLDLGIEVCLYDGMDAYVHTWLQFAFPLYIWSLVVLIIILSRYSSTVVKLVGTNAVPVLGTLFLLSYAKLQRVIITAFSFTYITNYFSDGRSLAVWLYDANLPFLQEKHIALFAMALAVSLLYIFPFTLLILFALCIQAWSNHRPMQWIHRRLKPLLDAYQAPFKDKFRYWAGLMLVARNILFIIFALNVLGDPNINLMVIVTVTWPLLMFSWVVHKKIALNILETSFILNLEVLAGWTLYNRTDATSNQTALVCTSVGIAFVTFVCVLVYHTFQNLTNSRLLRNYFHKRYRPRLNAAVEMEALEDSEAIIVPAAPTRTVVDLRESLLTDS